MLQLYLNFLKFHPLFSSATQVAILGTLGELIAVRIRSGRWTFWGPGPGRLLLKILVWAFLGITFKYAFTGFFGFVHALVERGFWFSAADQVGIVRALSVSIFTNLLFGPIMMWFHRITDNLIERKQMDWSSLMRAWKTLIWFWIPAHTVTFSLPHDFQVGLAAVWAVALGIILGIAARSSG